MSAIGDAVSNVTPPAPTPAPIAPTAARGMRTSLHPCNAALITEIVFIWEPFVFHPNPVERIGGITVTRASVRFSVT
jgi:hypothetical protein